jgi:NADPH-dependent 2,4-dienoyl-CoA reductase/sulfur reductase-like enzyme
LVFRRRCAREPDPTANVTVVVADAYPNFSICGIPYYISGEVTHCRNLAHRSYADLEATGMRLRLDTTATTIDVEGQRIAYATGAAYRRGSTTTNSSSAITRTVNGPAQ